MKNRKALIFLVMALIVVASVVEVSGQSTNQSSPTALAATEFVGKTPSKETLTFLAFPADRVK